MADNKENKNRAVFEKYLEENKEAAKRYAAMTPAEKTEFEDNFFKRFEQIQKEKSSQRQEGFTSDEWQQLLNGDNTRFLQEQNFLQGVDIVTLDSMGKLPSDFANLSPEEKAKKVEEIKAALTPEERLTFNGEEKKAKEAILETYPPKRLVDTDNWLMEAAGKTKDANVKAQLEQAHQTVLATMVKKTEDYAKGEIIVDQSNIADVYDGATLMFEHVEKQTNDANVKNNITISRDKLEKEIKIYDDDNGFTGLTEKDEEEIRKTYAQVSNLAENETFLDEDDKELLSHLQLTSKDPAKGLADAKEREEMLQMFHDSVREQAIRQTAVKNKGAKKEDLKQALAAEMEKAYVVQLGALLINNEMSVNGGKPGFTHAQAEANAQKAIADMASGKDYTVNSGAMVGQFANYTNDSMGWLNRLGTKVGKKAPVLGQMYSKVKKFDDTCIERFSPLYGQLKSFGKAVSGNMGRQALNQAVRVGSQLIPGGNFVYGSYVASQAVWRLGTKYKREKEEAKKNGQNFSGFKWLKNHIGEITSSAMLTAAAFIPGSEAVKVGLGIGSAVVASGTNIIKSYKRSREKGESKWKAFRKSLTSAGASVGTAVASSLLLGKAVEVTGLDDFTANYFKETVPAGEYNADDSHYSQSPVTDAAKQQELLKLDDKALEEQGYKFEQGVPKEAEGAFLHSKGENGFTTRDYSQDELKFAAGRNDGIRYSEYLDKQWVHEDYQDSNSDDPLAHSDEAHKNAISSLDKLAEKHPEMNSYIDGKFQSNSEMLLYKLYNANVLAPDANAVSDSGVPIGELLSAKDAQGNVVNYQDVFQKVLSGQELTETDYQVITKVEDHVGGQFDGKGGDVNDMGKLKDFNAYGDGARPVDSYNTNADVGYELNKHPGSEDIYARFVETQYDPRAGGLPWGMVFDNQENGQQVLRERIGANGNYLKEVRDKLSKPQERGEELQQGDEKQPVKQPQQQGHSKVRPREGEINEPVVDASPDNQKVEASAKIQPVEFPDIRADEQTSKSSDTVIKPVKGFDSSKVYMQGQRERE